jgi:small-conductance mechanosensitive channel
MDPFNIRLIETAAGIVVYIFLRMLLYRYIDKTVAIQLMHKTRSKIVKKAVNLILILTIAIFILIVWGVDPSEMVYFLSSILTVVGLAMIAQWSILSNITSGIILFFSHNIKLDDTIIVIDKDYEIEGRISDIGLFFVILKTTKGEVITIPCNVFIQKMVKKQAPKTIKSKAIPTEPPAEE